MLPLCGALALLGWDSPAARAAECALPTAPPTWIDFADGSVKFRNTIFRRPGLVVATSGGLVPQVLREGGAQTIYWQMTFRTLVGTPDAPADPATLETAMDALVNRAAASSGCAAPAIALNELLGPTMPTPWSPTASQYRANVLLVLEGLAARGARPFLLIPSDPNTAGDAATWWQEAAASAELVREVYFKAPAIVAQGPTVGSRTLRQRMRKAAASLTAIGLPASRVGLMLGFQVRGLYGRVGLQPREAWLGYVKLNALAAKQVASELGLGTVWSWGWGTFGPASKDPEKPNAACVYLWTRDASLCDGPARAGALFNASLTEGQLLLPAGVQCTFAAGRITKRQLDDATAVTGERALGFSALLARIVQSQNARVTRAQIIQAEAMLVQSRYRGSRAAYLADLGTNGISLGFARGILADELRRSALGASVGAENLDAWTVGEATKALDTATCLGDDLPAPAPVRLASYAPSLGPTATT